MRRSMVPMLVAATAWSTPLVAQSVALGVAGTIGGGWQVEAADVGYMLPIHAGPLRSMTLGARLGSFIDQGAIVGGARGFIGGLVLATRTGLFRIADVGNETNPSAFGVDLTFEAVEYAGSNSPLPQGSPWAAVSVLPGVRLGDGSSVRASFVIGPTVFFGSVTNVHPFLGIRFELPLAGSKSHP